MKRTIWRLLNFVVLFGPTIYLLVVPKGLSLAERFGCGAFISLCGLVVLYGILREFLDPIDNRTAPGAERYYPRPMAANVVELGGPGWRWFAAQAVVFVMVSGLVWWWTIAYPGDFQHRSPDFFIGMALFVGAIVTFLFATLLMHVSLWRARREERRQNGASSALDAIEGPARNHRVIPATADPRP